MFEVEQYIITRYHVYSSTTVGSFLLSEIDYMGFISDIEDNVSGGFIRVPAFDEVCKLTVSELSILLQLILDI
jgi:hypothetical protein